jgi:hypothetical protein
MYLYELPPVDQRVIRKALSGAFHQFPFYGLGNARSRCGVCYEIDHYGKDLEAACVLTEVPDNPGTSVTNYAEQLATTLYGLMLHISAALPVEAVRFYEYYPASRDRESPTIDRLSFTTTNRIGRTVFLSPQWQPVHIAAEPRLAG